MGTIREKQLFPLNWTSIIGNMIAYLPGNNIKKGSFHAFSCFSVVASISRVFLDPPIKLTIGSPTTNI